MSKRKKKSVEIAAIADTQVRTAIAQPDVKLTVDRIRIAAVACHNVQRDMADYLKVHRVTLSNAIKKLGMRGEIRPQGFPILTSTISDEDLHEALDNHTLDEAAKILGISLFTVSRLAKARGFPSRGVGPYQRNPKKKAARKGKKAK